MPAFVVASSRTYLAPLTGLRFLAALHVVLLHIWVSGHLVDPPQLLQPVIRNADVAVDFFFILSGFILTYTYMTPLGRTVVGGARRFWAARFARVYPVYALALLLGAPIFVPGILRDNPSVGVVALVTVPTLTQSWLPAVATAWNPPAWSLSTEAFFYLVFPLFMPLLARLGSRQLAVAFSGIYVVGLVAPVLYTVGTPADPSAAAWWQRLVLFGPPFHLPEFVLGAIVGLWFLRRTQSERQLRPTRRRALSIIAALGLIGYVAAAYLSDSLPRVFAGNGLFAPIYAVLIYSLARGLGSLPARALSLPLMTLLGEASYGLYLLHMPVIFLVTFGLKQLPDGGVWLVGRRWFGPLEILLAIGLSVAAFVWVERPGRRWLRRVFEAKGQSPAVAVTRPSAVLDTPGIPSRV